MVRGRLDISKRVLRGLDRLWANGTLRPTRSVSLTTPAEPFTGHILISANTSFAVFQQIDIDESTDATTGSTLRLFGLTKKGNSVLLHVHGFKPYFYVAAPKDFMTEDCKHLKDRLNVSMIQLSPGSHHKADRIPFVDAGLGHCR